jgi:Zn ribbon nucleic-acid-binding protein
MKNCKNCSTGFEITPSDRQFYNRINVPEPTLCPDCRQQRRYAIRNERNLYKRECDMCKKGIISMYSTDKPFPVYCPECWWGGKWHGEAFGRNFDFSRPFFDQFAELQARVPRIGVYLVNSQNCDYCNFTGDCKNCYLIFGPVYSEDCMYGSAYYSKNCLDNLVTRECELCYECTDSRKLYRCMYCQDCYGSDHLLFCYDMQGCSECIACAGLRNKKYHIENKPYSKEAYEAVKNKIDFCDSGQMQGVKKKLDEIKLQVSHHYMPSNNVQNVSGSHIYNSKNTFRSFFSDRCEDCAYCMQVVDLKDCYDNNYTEENELCCEYLGMYGTKNTFFSTFSRHTYEVFYSEYCINGKYLFGCDGILNKDHCILNKPYKKGEYEALIPKIIEHMKSTGEWGEFFPITHSPFAYNETVAQEYFPITKEEVVEKGYKWKNPDKKDYQPQTFEVPREINDVQDNIINEILACANCGKNYKILTQELKFYRDMSIPIPKKCPDCRHRDRLALRNPRKLFSRACAKCGTLVQTTYSPDRPEKVYCEQCYLKEVY